MAGHHRLGKPRAAGSEDNNSRVLAADLFLRLGDGRLIFRLFRPERRIEFRYRASHREDAFHDGREIAQRFHISGQASILLIGDPDTDELRITEPQYRFQVSPDQRGIDHDRHRTDPLDGEKQRQNLGLGLSEQYDMVAVTDPFPQQCGCKAVSQFIKLPVAQSGFVINHRRAVWKQRCRSAQQPSHGNIFQRKHGDTSVVSED